MNILYSPGDIDRMAHAVDALLPDSYALYRSPGLTGKYPPTPKYSNKKCSVQIVNRLVPSTGLQGQSETAPTRFVLRYRTGEDVRARDRVMITNARTGEMTQHTVESVRGPHSTPIWSLADISDPE